MLFLCRLNPTLSSSLRSKATYRGLITKLPGGGSELADAHSVIDSTLRDVADCVVLILDLWSCGLLVNPSKHEH
jgi:hypothetical protein